MKFTTTLRFRHAFAVLPASLQGQIKQVYQCFQENSYHLRLCLKQVDTIMPTYSVRITEQYCTLAVKEKDTLIWFWIGDYNEYYALLKQLGACESLMDNKLLSMVVS